MSFVIEVETFSQAKYDAQVKSRGLTLYVCMCIIEWV